MITREPLKMTKDLFISNNCWICWKSTVLKGAWLPDWSIVGARSLVNKDFFECLSEIIFAGSPANVLSRPLMRSDQKIINKFSHWCITNDLTILNKIPQ